MIKKGDRKWFVYGIAHLVMYHTEHGSLNVSEEYKSADGFELGEFAADIRERFSKGELSENEQKQLEDVGFSMNKDLQDWETMYRMAVAYVTGHGELPDAGYRTEDNVLVGAWVHRQIVVFDRLTDGQKEKLRRIGIGTK